ncbi:Mg2+ transporter protein, CorA-like/Zinc transport protein ZntB [Aspergillus terreus]|uniref:Mg2+ transporter protein, CorA-like/Zinc transport protein ZntB n=1 Tax=Aspergillus terreus TaxID=33178 RepID=A0A5M3Z264_ASPTE|nr:hypothetical protein ATETN484_0008002600 [Aspergillus terreus]GFF16452.1 Mg2+ transporter protein, CorA-like/Zinc transport protein ZntB [Aspergillus terreus]
MDDSTGSPASNTHDENPADEEEIIEQSSVADSDRQDNRGANEVSAADSVHRLEEAVAGGGSDDKPNSEEAATTSLSAALALEPDTDESVTSSSALSEISDQRATQSLGLDDETMQAIIAAEMEVVDRGATSYDLTPTSSYSAEGPHADTPPPDGPTDADQDLDHPLRRDLEEALEQGRIERVNELLASDPQLSNVRVFHDPPNEATIITPLCLAVTNGHSRIVEALLQSGAHVDALSTYQDGEISALHIAVIVANYTSVRLLLSQGASVNIPRAGGTTPLHDAILQQNVDIVDCLLQEGASPIMRDDQGNSAFHLASQFDCVEILDLLWAWAPGKHITEINESNHAPLHIASMKDCPKVVEWLLDKGAEVDQKGDDGCTPLHLASMHGNNSMVLILLRYGAQIEQTDCESRTPLLLACVNLQGQVMKTLFSHYASTTAVDSAGRGCLHLVIWGHYYAPEGSEVHPEYLEYLVGRGAVVDQPDHRGSTPLMDACQSQSRELIETLLNLGAGINSQDHMGRTPLLYACEKPDNGSLELLLRAGADVTLPMTGGSTALHIVCSRDIIDNVRTLLKYNAPVTVLDDDGDTPLSTAADCGSIDSMLELVKTREYFPENPAEEKAFIEPPKSAAKIVGVFSRWLKLYSSKSDLLPLLHWAISHGRFELTQQCLNYRSDALFWKMEGGATWLHVAAQYGHSGIINNLLGKINTAKEASGGVTALHVAATHGHFDTVRALLQIIANGRRDPDEASAVKATAIIYWDDRRQSPLTLSISRKHKRLEALFFDELKALGLVTGEPLDAIKASELLEILAEWEKPGRESVLKHLLECWLPAPPQTDVRHWSALHWAVHGSTAVVVWWLLSKGGYRSGDAIRECQRKPLVRADAIGMIIQELLRNPPPQMYEIANPVDDEPPLLPRPTDWDDHRLYLDGYIMNVYVHNENTVVPYTRGTLHGIIYSKGPNALMRGVEMRKQRELEQRDLNILKNKLGNVSSEDQSLPNIWSLSGAPSGGLGRTVRLRLPRYNFSTISPAENLKLRWIHLPVNELQLIKDLVTRLSHDSGRSEMDHRNLMKFFNRSWTELAAGATQHYMKPLCLRAKIKEAGEGKERTAIYMPYLTLGEYDPESAGTQTPSRRGENGDDDLVGRRDSKHVGHVPLTLDQYYYPGISDTSYRDDNQVFSTYLQKHQEKVVPSTNRTRPHARSKKKQILMVDQLWIWIVDDHSIITSTAQRREQSSTATPQDPKDSSMSTLLHRVLNDIAYGESRGRFERPTSVDEVMQLMLGVATEFFIAKCVQLADGTSKGPLEVFREFTRDVANRETELFQNFLGGLRDEIKNREARAERISQSGRPSIRELPNNPHHIISEETELLDQIRDINDELHMLRALAEDQEIVWNQAFAGIETQGRFSCTPTEIAQDLDGMITEAEMTRDSIDTLLDLRQKQASLAETEAGRLQANDTARQSNNIYVFTLVTIFFLPLSWLTSLFALNVTTFPHNGDSIEYQAYWLFPILFGVTGVFFTIAIFAPLRVEAFQDWMYNRHGGATAGGRTPPAPPPPANLNGDGSSLYTGGEDYDERVSLKSLGAY